MAEEALKELLDERYREIAEIDEAIGEFNAGCPAQLRLIAKRDALKANADAALSELARLRALSEGKLRCTGCGSCVSLEQLRVEHPNALSCCPERDMRPVESTVQSHEERRG